jgi:N-acetylmuramoyl-L-alanine amidase
LVAAPALCATDIPLYGTTYRPVTDIAAQYGMTSAWTVPNKTIELKNQYCTIDFTVNERTLRLNGEPMALGVPVVPNKNTVCISKSDFEANLLPLLSPQSIPAPPVLHRIIIDPGHGGSDPGGEEYADEAAGRPTTPHGPLLIQEKTNTLDVGLRLAAVLKQRGYDVLLTRTTDVTFERTGRPIWANQSKGDLYISIHFNKADDISVSGIETWILTPAGQPSTPGKPAETDKKEWPGNKFDGWNAIAGFSVERAVTDHLQAVNRGVKRERYDVLVPLNMPGMLIECGFMSNATERAKILTPAYRQTIAESIADGLDLYKATLDRFHPPKPPAATAPPASSATTATSSASAPKAALTTSATPAPSAPKAAPTASASPTPAPASTTAPVLQR